MCFKGDAEAGCAHYLTMGGLSGVEAVIFSHPGVAVVRWDPTCRAVHIEWQGWANPTEFAAVNEACLHALTQHHGSRWLGDLRKLKPIQQSDQDWITLDWFPRVLAAGLRRMALVVAISGLAMMNFRDILSRIPGTSGLDVAYFATVEEARAWLKEPSTHTPSTLEAQPIS